MERRRAAGMTRIGAGEYRAELPAEKHVFLVGDLKRPTTYPFLRDDRLEVVMVAYDAGDDGRYHWHPAVTEYGLVIHGEIGYREAASGAVRWFQVGDFFEIPAGVCVQRVIRTPARGLTIKVPSVSTKIHCEACERACDARTAAFVG
jgi:quercetin dioxygenase-like cupin family protein